MEEWVVALPERDKPCALLSIWYEKNVQLEPLKD